MKCVKALFVWFVLLLSCSLVHAGMPTFFHKISSNDRDGALHSVRSKSFSQTEKLSQANYTVTPDTDWTALFYNNTGEVGPAGYDGMNSFTLSGNDTYNADGTGITIFSVGDTLVGSIDPVTSLRSAGTYMIHNGFIVLAGNQPVSSKLSYCYGKDDDKLDSLMTPDPHWVGQNEYLYWPFDGIARPNRIRVFAEELLWDHETNALTHDSAWSMSAPKSLPILNISQTQVPLFFPETSEHSAISYGSSAFPNTVSGGSKSPDGYIYIFGCREDKDGYLPDYKVLAARVLEDDFETISKWHYWNGTTWGTDPTAAASLADHASNEMNVGWITLPDGSSKIILTYMHDIFSGWLTARYATMDPENGFAFSDPIFFYQTPEPSMDPTGNVFTYGAKAHPHLSPQGEILVSYNVNTFNNTQNWTHGNIYHPRFVRVVLSP